MGTADSEAAKHLLFFVTLTEVTAKAFPELPGISERTVLLAAMAHADAEGRLSVEVWAAQTGVGVSTLERYANYFASLDLMKSDEMSGGTVWLKQLAFARLEAAIGSESKQ
jgi:response regulator of citrate/malate metabolism